MPAPMRMRPRPARHMGAGAGAVGDVDRVGEPAQRRRLAQQVLRVAGHRRGDLRGHDKAACPQPLGKGAGQGDTSVAHGKLAALIRIRKSAYMLCRPAAIGRLIARFLDRKHRARLESAPQ